MQKDTQFKENLVIKRKISTAERKLRTFFKTLPADKLKFIEPPLHQLAVLQITLERLVDIINSSPVIEDFKQGKQEFRRENPALKSYNATIKSYTTLYKQLTDLLPDIEAQQAGTALMHFAAKPATTFKK